MKSKGQTGPANFASVPPTTVAPRAGLGRAAVWAVGNGGNGSGRWEELIFCTFQKNVLCQPVFAHCRWSGFISAARVSGVSAFGDIGRETDAGGRLGEGRSSLVAACVLAHHIEDATGRAAVFSSSFFPPPDGEKKEKNRAHGALAANKGTIIQKGGRIEGGEVARTVCCAPAKGPALIRILHRATKLKERSSTVCQWKVAAGARPELLLRIPTVRDDRFGPSFEDSNGRWKE